MLNVVGTARHNNINIIITSCNTYPSHLAFVRGPVFVTNTDFAHLAYKRGLFLFEEIQYVGNFSSGDDSDRHTNLSHHPCACVWGN